MKKLTLSQLIKKYPTFMEYEGTPPCSQKPPNKFPFFFVGYLSMLSVMRLYGVRWWDDWWMGRDLERSGHGLIQVYTSICLEGLRKTIKNLGQYSWCPNRDLNQAPIKYKFQTLLLDQPVKFHWMLSWACWLSSYTITPRPTVILSSHLC
jgi:hypothetical protein